MTNLTDYLGGIGKQEERKIDEIRVKKNVALDKIIKRYEKWLGGIGKNLLGLTYYDEASLFLDNINFSSQDITKFSLKLKEFEKSKYFWCSGWFLSALINLCEKEEEFEIITDQLEQWINFIGFKNKKKITVKGNTGYTIGYEMQAGLLIIEGNAGKWLGSDMRGGEIHVNGEVELEFISRYVRGGKIYHKGKLIINK